MSGIFRRNFKRSQRRRAFPDAMAQRCFFFEPTDAQVAEDKGDMPELMMFPPTESGEVPLVAPSKYA